MRGILIREADAPDPRQKSPRPIWALWLVAALALAAVPVVGVRYPPILDLPQQLAQIDLLGRALAEPEGPYRVQWWEPDKIGYPLLALARAAGNVWAPRLAVLLTQAAWITAVFALAARRGRAPEQAALATLFLWSGTFYGGFVHFLLGVVALVFWVPELARARPERSFGRTAAATFLGGLLLWLAHALWLAAGFALVPLALAARRAPRSEWAARALGLAPLAVASAAWYATFVRSGWDSTLYFGAPWSTRLTSPQHLASVLLGGLRGTVETWIVAALGLWLLAGLATARGRAGVDRALAALGVTLLLFALAAPESLGATAMFGRRWGWVGAVCLVLAVPPPEVRPALRGVFALSLVGALSAATFAAWRDFDRSWMAGFERTLARIGAGERVLGLDLVRVVPRLWIHPFFHMSAYAQVERGAEIGYSFAETPSSLVVFARLPAVRGWTPNLHLYPGDLVASDLDHFDWLLVVAPPDLHAALPARFPVLAERGSAGPWRLYRVAAAGAETAGGDR
jgi:hypothetical protein